ncbi:GNAT family N-acetyltransferase [Nocardia pseudobrasiliensis]|uniref:Putative acetyltransferase n=1 Tax=Nocardia pseudobrasiliensis TaxID=45979 RepID=A0A370I3P7_9NOCA|nr:GNAT family N-acetyltransferase [Nocardia pseudobrasiliensis]RDI64741.1 putative acetyltransferase [Nocardia pseudobrasiliensis]
MRIVVDDVTGAELIDLLGGHLADMYEHSPEDSVHALDLDGLRKPEVTLWTIWDENTLAGCGALKELDPTHGEIKSMRTAPVVRRRGVGALMLGHILAEARTRGYDRVSLETGTAEFFSPARRLYERHGFRPCPPFADYAEDPHSIFMTLAL